MILNQVSHEELEESLSGGGCTPDMTLSVETLAMQDTNKYSAGDLQVSVSFIPARKERSIRFQAMHVGLCCLRPKMILPIDRTPRV
jgi:hypothetical protein